MMEAMMQAHLWKQASHFDGSDDAHQTRRLMRAAVRSLGYLDLQVVSSGSSFWLERRSNGAQWAAVPIGRSWTFERVR
jgi:hypothetical protein